MAYYGDQDFVAAWLGGEAWTKAVDWVGQEAFGKQKLESWTVKGKEAGQVRSYENFTFATVKDAGHLVARDQPAVALTLIERFVTHSTKTAKQ